ncbi:ribosomal RNA small subunit methyltransferase A [Pelagibacterales bacterium SAG-MED07]|nr:ribosomal RNA small subunit methyltransferase A [Pelagibacterales bacterium SAG-MED07]
MFIKAKKSLGQNFLIDKNIINKIISLSDISSKEVLEVGPGTGNLTEYILKKKPSKLFLVEKDKLLCEQLQNKFFNDVCIINKDILKIDEKNISKNKLLVFGNLPYNISTEIICSWVLKLEKNFWFTELILMFQKEVADRIISEINTSNYGRLSIFLGWKLNIKKVFDIGPNCFVPKPKIDSSVLHFTPKKNYIKINNSKNLEMITRVFFNQRRKMIKNPLKQLFENYEVVAKKLNLDLKSRPQNLSLSDYCNIVKEYERLIC